MTDYTSVKVVDYNDDPAPDNGTTVSANQITWAGIKSELFDPIEDAVENVDTNLDTSFTSIPNIAGTQSLWIPARKISEALSYTSGSDEIYRNDLNASGTLPVAAMVSLPLTWDAGEIVVTPYIVEMSSSSGTLTIEVSSLLADIDDRPYTGFSSADSSTTTASGTQDDITICNSITHDVGGTQGDEKLLVLEIVRNSSDTYGATVGLVGIMLEYQTTAFAGED